MKTGDLTDAASWEAIWRGRRDGLRGRLGAAWRRRARWALEYDAALSGILDSAAGGSGAIDVLELGCAPGAMTEMLHRLRPQHRYAGVDIAAEALGPTRERLEAQGCAVELWSGDLREVTLPRRFDLVCSFGLIEHFDDPAEILSHHARLAVDGGMVAVTVPNYAHPVVARLLQHFSPETLATHNLAIMSEAAIATALGDAGLRELRTGAATGPLLPVSRPRRGPAGAVYAATARAWNVVSGLVPASRRPWDGLIWGTGRV